MIRQTDPIEKTCKGCNEVKPISDFKTSGRLRKDGTRGRVNYCHACIYKRRWNTPEKINRRTKYELERRRRKRVEKPRKSHQCSHTSDGQLIFICKSYNDQLVLEFGEALVFVNYCPICGKPSKHYRDFTRRLNVARKQYLSERRQPS